MAPSTVNGPHSEPGGAWIQEVHNDYVALAFKIRKTLFSQRSAYQQVDIVDTEGHGRMLLHDGVIMLSERDEFVYHEMIAHVPLFSHPDPRHVLIIGGGDGGTAREVLKHRRVETVRMVEIDAVVIEACRRYMPAVSYPDHDDRLQVIVGDGCAFVRETNAVFDVIIVDSTDPMGPSEPLFGSRFYADAARVLAADGILVTQAESPFYDNAIQSDMLRRQRSQFNRLHLYLFNTLTYPGGLWSFGLAGHGDALASGFRPSRVAAAGIDCRYYSADVHQAAFTLPPFVTTALGHLLDPSPFPMARQGDAQ
jgi:spermidine synthase